MKEVVNKQILYFVIQHGYAVVKMFFPFYIQTKTLKLSCPCNISTNNSLDNFIICHNAAILILKKNKQLHFKSTLYILLFVNTF